MKELENMTDEEVLSLEERDIEKYIDYTCATRGVPFIFKEPEKPILEDTSTDTKVFNIDMRRIYFSSIEDAQKVTNLIEQLRPIAVDYNDYIKKEVSAYDKASIEEKMVYSYAKYQKIKSLLEENEKKERDYTSQKDTYDEATKKKKEVAYEIYAFIQEVKDRCAVKTFYKDAYYKYLELFEGDGNKAKDALFKAYPDSDCEEVRVLLRSITWPIKAKIEEENNNCEPE